MRFLLLFLAVAVSAARGDFFDDFESYQPGEDPAIPSTGPGNPQGARMVTVQGDEQVIEAVFPDSAYLPTYATPLVLGRRHRVHGLQAGRFRQFRKCLFPYAARHRRGPMSAGSSCSFSPTPIPISVM